MDYNLDCPAWGILTWPKVGEFNLANGAASRIIAPLIQRVPHAPEVRDKGFKSQIRGSVRESLKDAIMYGVEADSRVADTHALVQAKTDAAQLNRQVIDLAQKVAQLEQNAAIYERWAKDEKLTMIDLQDLYSDTEI